MATSVGWGFVISPEIAAVATFTFLENELAAFVYMHRIIYHYSMPLVAVLVIGTVFAVGRLATARRRQVATATVTACGLVSCVLWGLAPFSLHTYPHWSPSSLEVTDINRAVAAVPPQAVVSAWYPYVAHLDQRTVYMWPTPFAARYWGLYTEEGRRLPFAAQVGYLVLPTGLTGGDAATLAGISPRYEVVDRVGDVAVYRRR